MEDLILKFFQNTCSDSEKESLFLWIDHSAENKEHYKRLRQLWDINSALFTEGNNKEQLDIAYSDLMQKLNEKNNPAETSSVRIVKLSKIIAKYAAIAVICFGISWFFLVYQNRNPEIAWQTVEVPAGQRVVLTMADGSKVWLNSNTKFTYPQNFSKDYRQVKLDGEAYFEVHHNVKVPFLVNTHFSTVKVLGTKFNVYAYDKEPNTETTLLEGKVEFIENKANGFKKVLKPNQRIEYNTSTSKMTVTDIASANTSSSWISGYLTFDNSPMSEIIHQLELQYKISIEVKDISIWNNKFTGKFRSDESLNDVLKVLSKKYRIKTNESKVIIYK